MGGKTTRGGAKDDQYLALLRAINVGGKNRLPMADLRTMFDDAGATDVRTYIQSGNVAFRASPALASTISTTIERSIADAFGHRVPVIVRSRAQFRAATNRHPFMSQADDPRALRVGFLANTPTAEQVAALDPDRSPPDAFQVEGAHIYLLYPRRHAPSKLTVAYMDRVLSTVTTLRGWNTVQALRALLGD